MYEGFAYVYDRMMSDIPYDAWFDALRIYLAEHGIEEGTVCELGCGTGSMTERFARAGFHMIGVDLSADMLAAACSRKDAEGLDIVYIQQDMEQLELAGPVDAVISVCDTMNYVLEETAMGRVFSRVCRFLKPGGYFIFDLKTVYCYRNVIGSRVFAEQDEDVSYIWDNYYDEDEQINEYALTIFQRQPKSRLYERIDEVHYQRAYSVSTVRELLEQSGLMVAGVLDSSMKEEPKEDSERIYMIAKKREDIDEQ